MVKLRNELLLDQFSTNFRRIPPLDNVSERSIIAVVFDQQRVFLSFHHHDYELACRIESQPLRRRGSLDLNPVDPQTGFVRLRRLFI
jgi:hypothetical protein